MKKMLLFSLAAVLFLTGCAHGYVVTLNDGEHIQTPSKPRLVNGFYYFKDASGHYAKPVLSANVREIAPTSMATPDPKFGSSSSQQ